VSATLATDLKQWAYCPRIVYYRALMPGAGKQTFKMEEGKRAQELIEGLEVRRRLSRYGFEEAQRRFGVWLEDEELGLAGKIDLLLEAGDEGAVVDFKLTSGDPGANHRAQLAGYAVLAERVLGLRVRRCLLVRIPDSRVFEFEVSEADREGVVRAITGMREMVSREELPEPTKVRGRCAECEYQNFCGDVW
jgi:CRISPR-associated exonuclease Cas4